MGKNKTVGLDTSIVIYLLEHHPVYFKAAYKIFQDIETGKCQAVFSIIGMIELLTAPKQLGRADLVTKYQSYLAAYDDLAIIDVMKPIISLSTDLRAHYSISTPDAIHLATAIWLNADEFITNDKALQKIKEIKVVLI